MSPILVQAAPQRRTKHKHIDPDLLIRDLVELTVNTPVVHDYSVALFSLKTIELDGVTQEYIELLCS